MIDLLTHLLRFIWACVFAVMCGTVGAAFACSLTYLMVAEDGNREWIAVGWALMFFTAPIGFIFGVCWSIAALWNMGRP
jgi:hypothetical protein